METSSSGTAMIAALVTPAFLVVASMALVSAALVRMGRLVDRARALGKIIDSRGDIAADRLNLWLERNAKRALYTERSISLFYSAIAAFVATSLAIVVDRTTGDVLSWFPVLLAIGGTLLLLAGAALMVVESRLSGAQVHDEIQLLRERLEKLTHAI